MFVSLNLITINNSHLQHMFAWRVYSPHRWTFSLQNIKQN